MCALGLSMMTKLSPGGWVVRKAEWKWGGSGELKEIRRDPGRQRSTSENLTGAGGCRTLPFLQLEITPRCSVICTLKEVVLEALGYLEVWTLMSAWL